MSDDAYNELARRILAAIISYRMGHVGVDRALKNYVPEKIHPSWAAMAEAFDRAISDSMNLGLAPVKLTDKLQ
jgi:hypothetical protein